MSAYDTDYKKLVLLLLPVKLHLLAVFSYVYAYVSPVAYLHIQFKAFMADTKYRLVHNGQHCHLRGLLNDAFDPMQRRIFLSDMVGMHEPLLLYQRSESKAKRIYSRSENKEVILNRRGFGAVNGFDFVINVPNALSLTADDIVRLRALTDAYKLVSKRYQLIYF